MPTSMRSWILTVLIPVFVLLVQGTAAAEDVDRLVVQLKEDDHKLRLSAAINLGNLGDKRAIPALTSALTDTNDSVRSAAVTSLGILVDGSTDQNTRQRVLTALDRLVKRDGNKHVQKQALNAYDRIRKLPTQSLPSGGIYVNIGAMGTKATQASDKLKRLMRTTTEQTFSKRASSMMTAWPAGGEPSAQQLRASKTSAYHVDGTLVTLETQNKGSATLVSCKVSMLIAKYPEKSMFGFLEGKASVESGSSPSEIQYAQEDCVTAVVEDLVSKKIIPTIQKRP
jgi:HEAT repeats